MFFASDQLTRKVSELLYYAKTKIKANDPAARVYVYRNDVYTMSSQPGTIRLKITSKENVDELCK